MANLVKTFSDPGDFSAMRAAEDFLREAGFSIGSNQRGDPRGIMFGDVDISKWRNLSRADRRALHGYAEGDMRNGPVTVTICADAPQEAKRAFHAVAASNAAHCK